MSTIRVDIEYQGTEQGAAQIGRLQQNLTAADAAQQATTRSATQLGAATTALGQQMGRVGTAAGAAGRVFAQLSPQLQRMVGLAGQAGSAMTGLAGSLGPLGVALGAATLATGLMAIAQERAAAAARVEQRATDRLTSSYETLLHRVEQAIDARVRFGRIQSGGGTASENIAASQEIQNEITLRQRALQGSASAIRAVRATGTTGETNANAGAPTGLTGIMTRALEQGGLAPAGSSGPSLTPGEVQIIERQIQVRMRRLEEMTGIVNRGVERTAGETSRLTAQAEDVESTPGRIGGGRRERTQTFAQQEAAAWREASDARRLYEELLEEGIAQEEALALQQASIDTQIHENRISAREREQEQIAAFYDYQRQREEEALDKAKEAARERSRANQAIGAEAAGIAKQVGSAYFDAFMLAVEGTLSLEDAMLAATKQVLRSIGEELVARGIGKILEGIAEIPSPTAATKIGGGVAMVGFGIGLGAASAAIPTPESKGAEQPRPEQDRGEDRGPGEVTIVFGNPVLTAGTQAQLARGMGRALKGDRTLPTAQQRN